MTYRFFKNVKTIEELKRQYKTLAFEHHPDKGGNVEDMQYINAEYDEIYSRVKNIRNVLRQDLRETERRQRRYSRPLLRDNRRYY